MRITHIVARFRVDFLDFPDQHVGIVAAEPGAGYAARMVKIFE